MVVGMLFCPWPGYRTAPDCLSLPRNVHLPSSQTTLREYQVEERAARVYRPSGRKSSVVTKTFLSSTKKKKNDFSQMAANAHCERQRSGRSRRKKKKKSQRQLAGRVKGARAVKSFYSKKKNNTNSHERKWMVCFFHPAATTHETAIPCMDIYYFQKGKKETQPPRHKKHQPRRSVSTRRSTVSFSFLSFWPPQTKQTLIITMARARLTDPSYSVIFERERRVEGRKKKDNNSTASTSRGYLLSPPL